MYAFGRTSSIDTEESVYFLIRSNVNPDFTLKDLAWTLISAVPTMGYAVIKPAREATYKAMDFSCTIDDSGVFSILYQGARGEKYGLQYNPDPNAGSPPPSVISFGMGAWRNITIPASYQWLSTRSSELFNFRDSQGKNTLMHVSISDLKTINVATLDPSTMTMNQGIPWNITEHPNSSVFSTTSNGRSIYTIGYGTGMGVGLGRHFYLYENPLTNASTSLTGPTKPYDANDVLVMDTSSTSLILKTFGDKVAVLNTRREADQSARSDILVFNGTGFNPLPPIASGISNFLQTQFMTVVDSPFPFLYYRDNERTYSIPLDGSAAGLQMATKSGITINDRYGDISSSPSSTSSVVPTSTWGSDAGQSHVWTYAGAIMGGVFGLTGLVAGLWWSYQTYRRAREYYARNPVHDMYNHTGKELEQNHHQSPESLGTELKQTHHQSPGSLGIELKQNHHQSPGSLGIELKQNYQHPTVINPPTALVGEHSPSSSALEVKPIPKPHPQSSHNPRPPQVPYHSKPNHPQLY
ncbi:hypothetical protein BGX31_007138 [Mortierella sp. GBA43]|nr:hypothetical protein BGX31_007138 [Mortierella sp. GBA43]